MPTGVHFIKKLETGHETGLSHKQLFLVNEDLKPVEPARRQWRGRNFVVHVEILYLVDKPGMVIWVSSRHDSEGTEHGDCLSPRFSAIRGCQVASAPLTTTFLRPLNGLLDHMVLPSTDDSEAVYLFDHAVDSSALYHDVHDYGSTEKVGNDDLLELAINSCWLLVLNEVVLKVGSDEGATVGNIKEVEFTIDTNINCDDRGKTAV
ncbi:hypothetical protein B9Z65_7284 [Elsinoe australis]|uniref:Uncharacterized protein n=1 Tax=Elsinoe australis TaxID=40998 RepID=A0A2P7Z6B2_9PEZI|nr:hypothetical protein B9Z65_7284 [Elsinoe australis]